jgi:hypothetical protein
MLHRFFALNGNPDIVVLLVVNEHFQAISLRKSGNKTFTMLIRPPWQITRDAT